MEKLAGRKNLESSFFYLGTFLVLTCYMVSPNPALAAKFAITIDDPNLYEKPLMSAVERDGEILRQLRSNGLRSALFVCGQSVDSVAGKKLLDRWDKAGHILANHSYSHLYYNSSKISFGKYSQDILRAEPIIRSHKHFKKIFRFPYLKSGETKEKRDKIREFLKNRGYSFGYVTIDASDWYISRRLENRLKADPNADVSGYKRFYLKHMWERAQYYDNLARETLGRSPSHTILIHHNLLSALFLNDLIEFFISKGWTPIDASEAFKDSIFTLEPNTLPSGESIIWAIAKEKGVPGLRYPAEDGSYEKGEMDKLGL